MIKKIYFFLCIMSIAIVTFYWSIIASDRYVSVAHVVLQTPEVSLASFNFSSMLSGGSGATKDLLLLADHLKSVDMLKKLDEALDLRSHYSNHDIDLVSRLSDSNTEMEKFHNYYLSRVHINIDEYTGVLIIRSEAFTPEMASNITQRLLVEGEKHMNEMGQRLAADQVSFIESQVVELGDRLTKARDRLLEYQNEHNLVSPTSTVESLVGVVDGLEAELAKMHAKKIALSNYLSNKSPELLRLNAEIDAMKQQIKIEKSKMTASNSGSALNTISSDYETLMLQEKFAQELYSTALAALESTRVEAIRKLKQVSVLQKPTYPEYAVEPRRIHNITVFSVVSLILTFIVHMLIVIIKDHRD